MTTLAEKLRIISGQNVKARNEEEFGSAEYHNQMIKNHKESMNYHDNEMKALKNVEKKQH